MTLRRAARARRASVRSRLRARRVLASRPALGELVPGTNGEAVVRNRRCDFLSRHAIRAGSALVFDGEIRNAAPGIEPIGFRKCRRRANIETARQVPQWSTSGLSKGSSSVVKIVPRKSHDPCCAKPGWCACPANRAPRPQRAAFHHRSSIDEHFDVAPACEMSHCAKLLRSLLDDVVIIVALRIDREWSRGRGRIG